MTQPLRNTKVYTCRLLGEGRAMVGEEAGRLYTYRYTVYTRMTTALREAVMRAILMFH